MTRDSIIWTAAILIGLAPVWFFSYYPTVDGPAHLALIQALYQYNDPSTPFYKDFFELQLKLYPNWFFHAFSLLFFPFFSPLTVEKIFVSFYLVSFPLALRYAARAFGPEAGFVGLFGIPLAHHALLTYGFYNSTFAFVFFLLMVGFWLRHAENGGARALAGYVVLAAGCYVCHLSGLIMAIVAIAVAATFRTMRDLLARRPRPSWPEAARGFFRRAVLPALGTLPAAVLALSFLLMNRLGEDAGAQIMEVAPPSLARIGALLTASVMAQYNAEELVGTTLFMLGVLGVLAVSFFAKTQAQRLVRAGRRSDLLAVFVVFTIIYLMVPFQLYVQWLPLRLQPYVLLALLLWLASRIPMDERARSGSHAGRDSAWRPVSDHERRTRRLRGHMRAGTAGVVLGVMLLLTSDRVRTIHDLNQYISEIAALAQDIEPGSTLLALPLGRNSLGAASTDRHYTLIQLGSYLAVANKSIDLKNYQLHTSVVPIVFRSEVWPWRHIASDADFITRPLIADVTRFRRATGRPVDAVILFGEPAALPTDLSRYPLTRALSADYRLAGVSEPRGIARLYLFREN
jgi:hypothetical protein